MFSFSHLFLLIKTGTNDFLALSQCVQYYCVQNDWKFFDNESFQLFKIMCQHPLFFQQIDLVFWYKEVFILEINEWYFANWSQTVRGIRIIQWTTFPSCHYDVIVHYAKVFYLFLVLVFTYVEERVSLPLQHTILLELLIFVLLLQHCNDFLSAFTDVNFNVRLENHRTS